MIIDLHNHVGADIDGKAQTVEQLKERMSLNGIEKAVIFPFTEKGNLIEASMKLLEHRSDSIIPFLRFDPKTTDAKIVEELLNNHDFAGVKLHPRGQNFDPIDERYFQIYGAIERSGKPLLFHTRKEKYEFSNPIRVARLAEKFPDMDIIMGHFAANLDEAMEYVKKRQNLYIETSVGGVTSQNIKERVEQIGAEKIIFGSDSPYGKHGQEVMKIRNTGLPPSEMDKILFKNIANILKL